MGDPVGPADRLEGVLRAFVRFCADNGWGVAFHQVPPALLPLYERLGFLSLKIGEEASVDLEQFVSHTSNLKQFRHTRRKFEKDRYQAVHSLPPHAPSLLDQVADVSQERLTPKGRVIWHQGIVPDVVVSLPEDAAPLLPTAEGGMTATELQASRDLQLLRAAELLTSR